MDWQTIVALATLLFGIVGGVWIIENRFERKLKEVKDNIQEVENRLQAGITENRQLIIKYIVKR